MFFFSCELIGCLLLLSDSLFFSFVFFFFFFFLSEDGIREVARVQKWSLPIYGRPRTPTGGGQAENGIRENPVVLNLRLDRSGKRGVRKECRSRGSPCH